MSKFEEVFEEEEEEKPSKGVLKTAQGVGIWEKKKVTERDEKQRKHKEKLREEIKKWRPE